MFTVADILRAKGTVVHRIDPDATVYEAIGKMVDEGVGALVVESMGTLCGILTERDYLRKVAVLGRTSHTTLVAEIMTNEPITTRPGASIDECLRVMTDKRIRHLPVVQFGLLIGIVSIGDLVKQKIRAQAEVIENLTQYIQGR